MRKEVYTVAVMPSSGRRIKTFSVSTRNLILMLASVAVAITLFLVIGSLVTWRYCRKQQQLASKAIQDSNVLQVEFEKQLGEIRKSYSDFRIILGIEEEEADDEAGKGGPDMPDLPDVSVIQSSPPHENVYNATTEVSSILKEAAALISDLDSLTGIVGDRITELTTTPSIWPVRFEPREQLWISSGFGRRKDPFTGRWKMHAGVDIPAPRGTPIVSTANGVVAQTGKDRYLGNYIEVRHSDRFSTLYGHMDRFAKNVKKGTKVERGDVIGYMGRTGRSTGNHVHYEVRVYGKRVNPRNYILN